LYALPQGSIDKKNWLESRRLAEVRDDRRYHITFDTYNDFNFKTKNMTLKDMYLKQLMSIPGITPEKAIGICKRHPTMIGLLEQLDGQTDQAKIQFFENLTKDEAVHTRKLTKAPATKLAMIFGHATYPTTWPR
jgi:hypothetical protein